MTSAGDLNKKIVFKIPTSIRNSEGSKEITYTSITGIRASIKQSNQQRALEVAPILLNTDILHLRYSSTVSSVTKDWLVNYSGYDHVIHTIEVQGKNEFIKLIVKTKE